MIRIVTHGPAHPDALWEACNQLHSQLVSPTFDDTTTTQTDNLILCYTEDMISPSRGGAATWDGSDQSISRTTGGLFSRVFCSLIQEGRKEGEYRPELKVIHAQKLPKWPASVAVLQWAGAFLAHPTRKYIHRSIKETC